MNENQPILDAFQDGSFWSRWSSEVMVWANENLFSFDTLIEISLILMAATIAWPISHSIRASIKKRGDVQVRYALLGELRKTLLDITFPIAWLIIQWIIVFTMNYAGYRHAALVVTSSMLTAWIVINIATVVVRNELWSKVIAVSAWIVAALNILGVLDETVAALDGAAVTIGKVNISVLTVIQGTIALGFLLWITSFVGQLAESRIKASPNLTPSIQVLSTKLLRISLAAIAFLFALNIVGIDITAFAVIGGAIGVGLGFGLQKIFANLVSGFILLLDKSIKPGDVIAVADYYGRVDSLGARYVSVLTRDGIEHLIPNEELITNRVENWSYSQSLVRIRKTIGIHYKSDVRKAIALCLEAAAETPRVLKEPAAVCHLQDFADSAVNLEVRFWIDDPMNGRANAVSALLLNVWDKFHQHGIEIPYPQRDLHLRSSDIKASVELESAA
jgi:small-conductance mechanosensitive channel